MLFGSRRLLSSIYEISDKNFGAQFKSASTSGCETNVLYRYLEFHDDLGRAVTVWILRGDRFCNAVLLFFFVVLYVYSLRMELFYY